jgi:uncharacterized protein YcbK (DUF882 family)
MTEPTPITRRRFVAAAALALAGVGAPAFASAQAAAGERRIALEHLHTGEALDLVYAIDGEYLPESLAALDWLLRDHRSGEVGSIEPALFDLLHRLQQALGESRPFHVVSAFRGAATNARLRAQRGAAVARRSLHLEGRAIDVRLPGVPLARLRDAALALRAGGVGFYPRSQFLHLDTGAVRRW